MNISTPCRRSLGCFLCLASLWVLSARVSAQTPALVEAKLSSSANPEINALAEQIRALATEVFSLKTELVASNFHQVYGDHVRMQRVWFAATTPDKATIPAEVFTPSTIEPGKKLPAVIFVHGGNHDRLTVDWFPWIDEAVRRGYVVIHPEYRGSAGFGEAIYKNNYGVSDVSDVLAAAAYFAGKDFVDAGRMGILGNSRGGMITLGALEREPKRFKVAVELSGNSDLVAFMSYQPAARREDMASQEAYGGKLPEKNLAAYIDASPAFSVKKIETPILVLSATNDTSVPYKLHNKRVVEALKSYGKVFDEHLYENAPGGHLFPTADTPEGKDAMKRSFAWLEKYLQP